MNQVRHISVCMLLHVRNTVGMEILVELNGKLVPAVFKFGYQGCETCI